MEVCSQISFAHKRCKASRGLAGASWRSTLASASVAVAEKRPNRPRGYLTGTAIENLKSIFDFCSTLGRFPAKVGPGTVTNGTDSEHDA